MSVIANYQQDVSILDIWICFPPGLCKGVSRIPFPCACCHQYIGCPQGSSSSLKFLVDCWLFIYKHHRRLLIFFDLYIKNHHKIFFLLLGLYNNKHDRRWLLLLGLYLSIGPRGANGYQGVPMGGGRVIKRNQ